MLAAGVHGSDQDLHTALTECAAAHNAGISDLETFVMSLVALTSRDAVVNSLHAVGYGTEVRSHLSSDLQYLHLWLFCLHQVHIMCFPAKFDITSRCAVRNVRRERHCEPVRAVCSCTPSCAADQPCEQGSWQPAAARYGECGTVAEQQYQGGTQELRQLPDSRNATLAQGSSHGYSHVQRVRNLPQGESPFRSHYIY